MISASILLVSLMKNSINIVVQVLRLIRNSQIGYAAPDPPVFSGQHRYMIFAYEQLEPEIEVLQPEGRAKFDLLAWFESFGGEEVIRGPVASIGFKSEF